MKWICSLNLTSASRHTNLHCLKVDGGAGEIRRIILRRVSGEGQMVEKIIMVSRREINLN